jgi:outer membrane receptor protein involved in Fe transport
VREAGYGFSYREHVHALYGTYGAKKGVYGLQLGLRLEQVFTAAALEPDSGEVVAPFRNDYFALYPSVNLSRQRDDEHTWALSYSRRVNRPGGMQVNPFVDDSDVRNIRIGNPALLPEFTHSLEFSHQWSRGRASLTTSLFFKQTTDVIRWYRTVNDLGITTSTFVNLDSRHDEGLETVVMWPLGKSGSVRATASIYYLTNNVSGLEAASSNSGWSWNVNGFANIPLGKVWKCQITEMYMGPSVTPQGQFDGFHATDIAVQRSWSDAGLDLSMRVSDVFDTRQWAYSTVTSNFEQEAVRKRQSRMGYVTLTWKFGKLEPGRGRGRGEGMPGGGFEGGGDF